MFRFVKPPRPIGGKKLLEPLVNPSKVLVNVALIAVGGALLSAVAVLSLALATPSATQRLAAAASAPQLIEPQGPSSAGPMIAGTYDAQ
jgi:hypothetical protein